MSRKDGITEREFLIGEKVLQDFKAFFKVYNENLIEVVKKLPVGNESYTAPCAISCLDRENREFLNFVESDNKILCKILLSLASLCNEMSFITGELRVNMNDLFRYAEGHILHHPVKRFGSILSKLLHLRFTLKRSQQIIKLLLKQMCAILGKAGLINTILFPEAVERLCELLVSIMTLDTMLSSKVLSDHLHTFKRTLKTYDIGTFHIALPTLPFHSIQSLNDRLIEIEAEVLSGTIFSRTIESSFDDSIQTKRKTCNLSEQFILVILQSLTDLEKEECSAISFQQSLLHANILLVFNHYLSGSTDKKIIRRISYLNRKTALSCYALNGNVVWNPQTFLVHHLKLDKGTVQTVNTKSTQLVKESRLFSYQMCAWLIELDIVASATGSGLSRESEVRGSDLLRAHNTLMHGLGVCRRVRDAATRNIAQMRSCDRSTAGVLRRIDAAALCHLFETLEAARIFTVHRHAHATAAHARLLAFTRQHSTYKALSVIAQLKRNIREERKYKNEQLDILSTLSVIEHALKGPNSLDRILIAKLALSASALSNEEKFEVRELLHKLEILCNYNGSLSAYFDVSIMQCYTHIFDVYIMRTLEAMWDLSRIQLCASAMAECAQNLCPSLVETLSGHIETRLRLQTHAHLQRSAIGESQQHLVACAQLQSLGGGAAVAAQTSLRSLLGGAVESRLARIFYNLTTVVLHDWRTYGEMRRLASRQFALETVDDNLPMHTLDQGLDILEIMRNIDVFVAKYLYNMNDHVFVQDHSNNKHLNTVNITHVANSIRTHGIGIMSTAVNFTYQFLQKKFYIFSQFMFDEHIKSKLLKEMRFFAENKTETNELYPYENAEKFNADIRKLGLNSNGLSYLDLFRVLITQIGNALGYIRLVKAGGERCLADAASFLPNLQTIHDLVELLGGDCNSTQTTEYLRKNINIIVGNFHETTEYFKLLINVFAPVLLLKSNRHLRNFYMIIPPLTINFVEHSLTCKDRLNKRNRDGASFTDDGFAMGVTYITVLLKQTNILNSLHWARAVKTKFVRDGENLRNQMANASKEDAKLQQTLALSEKRIASIEKEFQLLIFNLSNAQIFFQKGNV